MDVLKRVPISEQPADVRNKNFEEVCLGYTKEELKTCLKECREKVKEYGRVLRVKGNVRDAEGYLSFESITGRDYIEESLEKETAIVVIGQNLQKERLFGLFTGKSVG